MELRRIALPPGRQFAVTWSIPEQFGGMTRALLHRSRAFVRLGRTPVDVLTFDPWLDATVTSQRLHLSGELVDGMRLLNIYDWFRSWGLTSTGEASTAVERVRTRAAADGTVLQLDHLRADGTLVVSDRRDELERGTLGGRSVVLCDAGGAPVRSWGSIWGLYRFWLDELRRHEPSFFIVDSKTMAPFAMSYRRKRAVMMHVVHASHLAGTDPLGALRESRRAVFEQPDAFDSVVLLTPRQRDDVIAKLGPLRNLAVIPNSTVITNSTDPPPAATPRGRGAHGVMLASLTTRKRVDHAIRAIALAAERTPEVRLDVFGEGEERPVLEQLIHEVAPGMASLHGYRTDASERFGSASYMLLTANSEGFPLVLIEAMAAGCIPICYDVPYGPADVVRHGVNGYLVPSGDIEGIADAIVALTQLPPSQVARMRRDARRTAKRYSDRAVTRAWAVEQRRAERRKLAAWPAAAAG